MGCWSGNHQWCLQQLRRTRRRRVQTTGWAQQKEAGGNGQLGNALSPKALAPTRRTTTKKRERNAAVASPRQGTHWLTPPASASQYLWLPAWNAVLVPTRHLREPLLGGRTTQSSAGTPCAALPAQVPWQPPQHTELGALARSRDYGPSEQPPQMFN